MRKRTLGSTGIKTSSIGLGIGQFAGSGHSVNEIKEIIQTIFEYDPLQIVSDGDALSILKAGSESSIPKEAQHELTEKNKASEIKSSLVWDCNISFRKDIFGEIGYFSPQLGRSNGRLMRGEETYLQIGIMNIGCKVIYEPNAVVTHIIEEGQLKEDYLVKRFFCQGFSEIERLKITNNFKHLKEYRGEFERIISFKFLQEGYKIYGLENLKEKIDVARSMGRLFGLENISKGFSNE